MLLLLIAGVCPSPPLSSGRQGSLQQHSVLQGSQQFCLCILCLHLVQAPRYRSAAEQARVAAEEAAAEEARRKAASDDSGFRALKQVWSLLEIDDNSLESVVLSLLHINSCLQWHGWLWAGHG
jgi:hypothetical protein